MAYRIDYGPAIPKKKQKIFPKLRLQALTAVLLLLFVLGVKYAWPAGTAKLRQALLPNGSSATGQAVAALTERIGNGEAIGDAVTAFCQEILKNAQDAR